MKQFLPTLKWEGIIFSKHIRRFASLAIVLTGLPFLAYMLWRENGLMYGIGPAWLSAYNTMTVLVAVLSILGFALSAIFPFQCFMWNEKVNLPERLSGHSYAFLFAAKAVRAVVGALLGHTVFHFANALQYRFDIGFHNFFWFIWSLRPFGWFAVIMTYAVVFIFCPIFTLVALGFNSKRNKGRLGELTAVLSPSFGVAIFGGVFAGSIFLSDELSTFANSAVIIAIVAVSLAVSAVVIWCCVWLYDNKVELNESDVSVGTGGI